MWRKNEKSPWSSLETFSNKGTEDFRPPTNWTIGHGQGGSNDRKFRGKGLNIQFIKQNIQKAFQS
jgi:hypothetical protein